MKCTGRIEQVTAIQDAILKTKKAYVSKRTGWRGEPGIEPSTLYNVRLSCEDRTSQTFNGYLFYVSFQYEQRDDIASVWVKDNDTGRLFKVFPEIYHMMFGLDMVVLPPEQAELVKEEYRIKQILRRSVA